MKKDMFISRIYENVVRILNEDGEVAPTPEAGDAAAAPVDATGGVQAGQGANGTSEVDKARQEADNFKPGQPGKAQSKGFNPQGPSDGKVKQPGQGAQPGQQAQGNSQQQNATQVSESRLIEIISNSLIHSMSKKRLNGKRKKKGNK